jgi:hypothetical protein
VLDGHHPPGGEGAAIADAVDLVEDGHAGVTGSEEVRVQRVDPSSLDGPSRRHERLGGHLAPEDALAVLVGAHPPEDVDLDGLDVEKLDEEVEGVAHHPILTAPEPGWAPKGPGTGPPLRGDPRYGFDNGHDVFPDGFLWGAATAAHQIEGGNVNNDWWAFEHAPGTPCTEPSGDACDSWHRWPEDLELLAELGFGAYRFSLEWSRIEPEEGEWSVAASTTTGVSAPRPGTWVSFPW